MNECHGGFPDVEFAFDEFWDGDKLGSELV